MENEFLDRRYLTRVVNSYLIPDDSSRACYLKKQVKLIAANREMSFESAAEEIKTALAELLQQTSDKQTKKALEADEEGISRIITTYELEHDADFLIPGGGNAFGSE